MRHRSLLAARLRLAVVMVTMLAAAGGCASTPMQQANSNAYFTTIGGLEAGKVSLEDAATFKQVMLAARDAYVTGQVTELVIAQMAFLTDDVQTSPTLLAAIKRVIENISASLTVPDHVPDPLAVAVMDGIIDGAEFYIRHPPPGIGP